jgi:hypothetical protein
MAYSWTKTGWQQFSVRNSGWGRMFLALIRSLDTRKASPDNPWKPYAFSCAKKEEVNLNKATAVPGMCDSRKIKFIPFLST